MIISVEYEVNGTALDHNGFGTLESIPLDLSSMNIPEGYPEEKYAIVLGTEYNFHEFSSSTYAVSIRATIKDENSNIKIIDNSYYANFVEI